MDLDSARRRLRNTGWLRNLPDSFRDPFLEGARLRRAQSGETLFQISDRAGELIGLADGLLDSHIDPGTGTSRLSFVAHPGWWLGSVAVVNGGHRRATIVARSQVTLLSVPNAHLEAMAARDGTVWKQVAGNVAAHFDSMSMLLLASTHPEPMTRILVTLSRLQRFNFGAVEFPVTQSELAEMAALSRNTANRVIRTLVQDGLIETGYGWFRITDPAALSSALADIWVPARDNDAPPSRPLGGLDRAGVA